MNVRTERYNTMKPCKACGVRTSALFVGQCMAEPGWVHTHPDCHVFLHPRTANAVTACRGCGEWVRVQRVKGKKSEKHVCNAKCLESTGFLCECSCGGKNHGASHSVAA